MLLKKISDKIKEWKIKKLGFAWNEEFLLWINKKYNYYCTDQYAKANFPYLKAMLRDLKVCEYNDKTVEHHLAECTDLAIPTVYHLLTNLEDKTRFYENRDVIVHRVQSYVEERETASVAVIVWQDGE